MTKIKKASNPKSQELKFSLLVLVLTLFCSFLMVIAVFTQLKLYSVQNGHIQIINYIPQIPTVMFIAGLLGKRYGTTAVIIYILTGLLLVPVFALGGGLTYIVNPSFGYILGFVFCVYFASKIIVEKSNFLRLVLADIVGVLTIHIMGIAYMAAIFMINNEDMDILLPWAVKQSFDPLFTDLLLGFFAIFAGNLIKKILRKIS